MACALRVRLASSKAMISRKVTIIGLKSLTCAGQALTHFTGFYERVPFRGGQVRSVYHVREFSVRKLSLVRLLI
jgi:hypothetical protein